jgi:hypothetical protein
MEKVRSKTERNETKKKSYETIGNLVPNFSSLNNNNNNNNGFKQQAPTLASQPISLNQNTLIAATNSNTTTNNNNSNEKTNEKGKFLTLGRNKAKKAITKADISMPTNFRVVQHVGLTMQSTNKNFEVFLFFFFEKLLKKNDFKEKKIFMIFYS